MSDIPALAALWLERHRAADIAYAKCNSAEDEARHNATGGPESLWAEVNAALIAAPAATFDDVLAKARCLRAFAGDDCEWDEWAATPSRRVS